METAPDDILFSIFEVCSRRSLFKLLAVNKRLHALGSPQLYRIIKWKWEQDATPPILLLLRTIFSRPTLRSHIQHVELQGKPFFYWLTEMPKIPMDSISALELSSMLTTVEEIQSNLGLLANVLLKEFRAGTMDAIVAVLLSQLPNLRFLHLGENFTIEVGLIAVVVKTILCAPRYTTRSQRQNEIILLSSLQSLQEVHFMAPLRVQALWGQDEVRGNPAWGSHRLNVLYTAFLPFLYAPQIERISAVIEEPISFDWLSWDDRDHPINTSILPPIATTLRHLDITLLREPNLGKILAQCTNLESLRWKFYAWIDRSMPPPFLDCDELGKALDYVRATLTSLILVAATRESDEIADDNIPEYGILSTLSTLQAFPRLSKVEIPLTLLLGHSRSPGRSLQGLFPRSLKELKLTDDMIYDGKWDGKEVYDHDFDWEEEELFAIIGEWFGGRKESVPELEKFSLFLGYMENPLKETSSDTSRRLTARFGFPVEVTRG